MGSRLLVWLLVISISAHAFAKRAKGGKAGKAVGGFGGPNLCESKDEFNKCKDFCYDDRDCNDSANLNCGIKCKMACEKVEKLGKCKSAMLYSVLDIRGRLDKKGGKRSKGGKKH